MAAHLLDVFNHTQIECDELLLCGMDEPGRKVTLPVRIAPHSVWAMLMTREPSVRQSSMLQIEPHPEVRIRCLHQVHSANSSSASDFQFGSSWSTLCVEHR